jgi:hypothetical protein
MHRKDAEIAKIIYKNYIDTTLCDHSVFAVKS